MYDEIPVDIQMMIKKQFFNCNSSVELLRLKLSYEKLIRSFYLSHVELLGCSFIKNKMDN